MVQHHPTLNRPAAPVCSVCIANYNGVHMLAECLDSVLAQDIGAPVEIIVHDDASTDDSVAFLREHYPQVEVLASGENVGFCIANNRMIAHARGEYVLLLNNDAALHADALRTLLATAQGHASPGIYTLPQYDWHSGELVDRGCLLDPFYNPVPNLDSARRDVAYVIGACLFMPRELWDRLGGFPEWIGSIAEDMYLCCLARLRGLQVAVTSASGYRHKQGASFGGNRIESGRLNTTYRRRALSERNKTTVLVVCTPTLLAWPLLALHVSLLALEGGILALLKRDPRIWRDIYGHALGWLIHEFGALSNRRRAMQSVRQVSFRTYWSGFVCVPRKVSLLWRHGLPRLK
jgi:GT2 family glycosyltransferase